MAKYQGERSEFEFIVNESKKVFQAQASGSFSVEDGKAFQKEYDNLTRSLSANTYTLIINAPELKPSTPDVAEMLGTLLQKYMSVPFKARYLVTKGNPVTMMQFKRLGSAVEGWTDSVQYVNDLEDAMKNL